MAQCYRRAFCAAVPHSCGTSSHRLTWCSCNMLHPEYIICHFTTCISYIPSAGAELGEVLARICAHKSVYVVGISFSHKVVCGYWCTWVCVHVHVCAYMGVCLMSVFKVEIDAGSNKN